MKKFRLGVVGLGHRGRGMFKGVAKGIGDFEAVAACDLNPALWFEPTNSYYGGILREGIEERASRFFGYSDRPDAGGGGDALGCAERCRRHADDRSHDLRVGVRSCFAGPLPAGTSRQAVFSRSGVYS